MFIFRFISHLVDVIASNYRVLRRMRREDRERAIREEKEQRLVVAYAQLAPSYAEWHMLSPDEALKLIPGLVRWITQRMTHREDPTLDQLALHATVLHGYDEWDKKKTYQAYETQRCAA